MKCYSACFICCKTVTVRQPNQKAVDWNKGLWGTCVHVKEYGSFIFVFLLSFLNVHGGGRVHKNYFSYFSLLRTHIDVLFFSLLSFNSADLNSHQITGILILVEKPIWWTTPEKFGSHALYRATKSTVYQRTVKKKCALVLHVVYIRLLFTCSDTLCRMPWRIVSFP